MSDNLRRVIDDGYWLRTHANSDGIPADCSRAYQILLNSNVKYFKNFIDSVIRNGGNDITVPMQPAFLESYLSGFSFSYHPLCNLYEYSMGTEGFWRFDENDPSRVLIFYNNYASVERQRYTKIHELFHFVQTMDGNFLYFLDNLIENSTLPENVVIKILERTTEKAAAMYLMPNDFFLKKYREIEAVSSTFGTIQIKELATAFGVSVQAATYRIQECVPRRFSVTF